MKIKFLLALIFSISLIFLSSANAQIPNNGFENWTSGEPNNWITDNIPGVLVPVTQSAEAHSGSSSVKLTVLNSGGGPYLAYIYTASTTNVGFIPGSLTGFYKFSPAVISSVVGIAVALYKNNQTIGGGTNTLNGAAAYTQFYVPLSYSSTEIPDSLYIFIAVDDSSISGSTGSTANIDDLSFSNATGVNEEFNSPLTFQMKQNYPNPFNPSTKIQYTIPEASFVTLKVFNILGKQVDQLINEDQNAGTYRAVFDAKDFPSGIYIAKLSAGNYTKTIKMILLK